MRTRKTVAEDFNNRRGILGTLFKCAFQKEWVPYSGRKDSLPQIARGRKTAKTVPVVQAAEVMAFIEVHEGARVGSILRFACWGIRPCLRNGEILKLNPDAVRLDTNVILIEPEVQR